MTEMYFLRYSLHRLPVQSRKHVLDKERIHLEFDLFQFCFLGMKRERRGRGLARLTSTSQEVERE